MAVYSHSKLQTYEQCALKYKLRYIDKIKPEIEATIEQFVGKLVHSALEFLYREKMDSNLPELDEVLAHFLRLWTESYNSSIKINKDLSADEYRNKGVKFITNYYMK